MNNHHLPERPPFAEQTAKREKRHGGRTDASHTPLDLRTNGHEINEDLKAWIYDRTGRQLGKFATQIERISVRLSDENGPRGGIDRTCTLEVSLSSLPNVVVTEKGATDREAFDRAAGRAERATRRSLQRHGFSAKAVAAQHDDASDEDELEQDEGEGLEAADDAANGAESATSVRPPRKSTHGGPNGELIDAPLRLRARDATQSPQQKAVRAQARGHQLR